MALYMGFMDTKLYRNLRMRRNHRFIGVKCDIIKVKHFTEGILGGQIMVKVDIVVIVKDK